MIDAKLQIIPDFFFFFGQRAGLSMTTQFEYFLCLLEHEEAS